VECKGNDAQFVSQQIEKSSRKKIPAQARIVNAVFPNARLRLAEMTEKIAPISDTPSLDR
jgi:hypothetical protein